MCRCFTLLSLSLVFFRLTNRCLEWTWTVLVLQWAFGPPGAPMGGWGGTALRSGPSATSSGSKWMREDGGQGAPHPSISPLSPPPTTCAQSFIHLLSFFPPFSFQTITTLESIDSTCPVYWSSEREYGVCKRLAALTVLFAIIFFFYIYIFGGFKIHISYKKAAGTKLYRLLIYLYQINSESIVFKRQRYGYHICDYPLLFLSSVAPRPRTLVADIV